MEAESWPIVATRFACASFIDLARASLPPFGQVDDRRRRPGRRVRRRSPRREAPARGCRLCGNIPSRRPAGSGRRHLCQAARSSALAIPAASGPSSAGDPKSRSSRLISQHAKKRLVGLHDLTVEIENEYPDDIGVDQAPDLRLPFLKIAIETRVLQRDRGLRRQQFQDRDPSRRECVRGQRVFEQENPGQMLAA